jgi:uncharacterized protein YdhG (YjbR/CyaY superfamily)
MKAAKEALSVDAYVQSCPKAVQKRLTEIRSIVRSFAPDAVEKISYRMPAFFLNGALVWFAAFKNHIGFYPGASTVAFFQDEIKGYKRAKGSIQFPHDRPLPAALIKRIVQYRVKENREKRLKKKLSL